MKTIAAIAIAVLFVSTAAAQFAVTANITAESVSGQFIVHGGRTDGIASHSVLITGDKDITFIQAPLLAISCERVKQALWDELGEKPSWKSRIHLYLRTARTPMDIALIDSERVPNGWNYRVFLPDAMQQNRFVDAIVQVLLLEIANRRSDGRSADMPAWLVEGFSRQLQASSQSALLVAPPMSMENGLALSRFNFNGRRLDPASGSEEALRAHPPLTFAQLSWPAADQFQGEAGEVFRCSAQLFVNRLLQLKNGRGAMRAMLNQMARRYNWQLAMLDAFNDSFPSPLDIEKWWALQLAHLIGRDLNQTWTSEETWKKLDEILHASVEVWTKPNEMPLRTAATLQTILRQSDGVQQSRILPLKLQELYALRLRASQELIPLVDDYRAVLGVYVQKHVVTFTNKRAGRIPDRPVEEAATALDALDVRREAQRPESLKPVATASEIAAPAGR